MACSPFPKSPLSHVKLPEPGFCSWHSYQHFGLLAPNQSSTRLWLKHSRASPARISKPFQTPLTNHFQRVVNHMIQYSQSDDPTSLVWSFCFCQFSCVWNKILHTHNLKKKRFYVMRIILRQCNTILDCFKADIVWQKAMVQEGC